MVLAPQMDSGPAHAITRLLSLLFIMLCFAALHPALALEFTEIMYDPAGTDANREFIELYDASGIADLSGWTVADAASDDTLVALVRNESSEYALIVQQGFDASGLPCSVYSAGATIGNGLNNNGDDISLLSPSGEASLNASYLPLAGQNDGYSLVMDGEGWRAGASVGGTPCSPETVAPPNETANGTDIFDGEPINDTSPGNASGGDSAGRTPHDIAVSVALPPSIYSSIPYDGLFRVSDTRHVPGEQNSIEVTVNYWLTDIDGGDALLLNASFSVTINSYTSSGTGSAEFPSPGNYSLCGRIVSASVEDDNASNDEACATIVASDPFSEPCNISLEIRLAEEKPFYLAGEPVRFRNSLVRHDNSSSIPPFIIDYSVSDLFGEELSVKTTENEREKSYTPKVEDELGAFVLRSRLVMLACNNSAASVEAERVIVVRGEREELDPESSVEILDTNEPQDGFSPGSEVRARIKVYRGETAKYTVKLWVEDEGKRKVSAVTGMNAHGRFESYEATLPLRLDDRLAAGEYWLVLEGLDERDTGMIKVKAGRAKANATQAKAPAAVPLSISSFYTRSKKPAESIRLYSTIKGTGAATAEVIGAYGHERTALRLNGSEQVSAEVALAPGPNIFLLRLLDEESSVVAERSLLLEVDEEIRRVERFNVSTPECGCEEEASRGPAVSRKGGTARDEPKAINESEHDGTAMTGAVVAYEPDDQVSLVPFLLGGIGLLLLGVILEHRR